jgi:hypothetical protein
MPVDNAIAIAKKMGMDPSVGGAMEAIQINSKADPKGEGK